MNDDTRLDRLLLWAADRAPADVAARLRWRVEDRRLDRKAAARDRAAEALRNHRRNGQR